MIIAACFAGALVASFSVPGNPHSASAATAALTLLAATALVATRHPLPDWSPLRQLQQGSEVVATNNRTISIARFESPPASDAESMLGGFCDDKDDSCSGGNRAWIQRAGLC